MEIKINREIRDYTESVVLGLSVRQFVFSILAIAFAVIVYFPVKEALGNETASWMCILVSLPFALLGFVKYHSMTAEQLLWAYIRSELIEQKQFTFQSENIYMTVLGVTEDNPNYY